MKKLFLILLAFAFTFAACNRDGGETPNQYAEVSFDVNNLTPTGDNGLKEVPELPGCSDSTADYVMAIINGDTSYIDIYTDQQGNLHTEVCKIYLPEGEVAAVLSEFYVYHDNPPYGQYGPEDLIVYAAPLEGSEFQQYLEHKLNIAFTVRPFYKTIIDVDVLCYDQTYYEEFGFLGSNIHEYALYDICLFGDLCIDTAEFAGSVYEQQENGLQYDVPAIMQVYITNVDGDTIAIGDNMEWLGEGQPLCLRYTDDTETVDDYVLHINIWLPTAEGFQWVNAGSLDFQDNKEGLDLGDDGILDFVLGDCACEDGDYVWTQGCIEYDPMFEDSAMFYGVKITDSAYFQAYQDAWGGYSNFYNPIQEQMNTSTWIYLVHNGIIIYEHWSDGNSYGDNPNELTGNNGYIHYYAKNSCDQNIFKIQLNWVKSPDIMDNVHLLLNVQRQPEWNFYLTGNEVIPKGANGKVNMIWYPSSYPTPVGDWQKTNIWEW